MLTNCIQMATSLKMKSTHNRHLKSQRGGANEPFAATLEPLPTSQRGDFVIDMARAGIQQHPGGQPFTLTKRGAADVLPRTRPPTQGDSFPAQLEPLTATEALEFAASMRNAGIPRHTDGKLFRMRKGPPQQGQQPAEVAAPSTAITPDELSQVEQAVETAMEEKQVVIQEIVKETETFAHGALDLTKKAEEGVSKLDREEKELEKLTSVKKLISEMRADAPPDESLEGLRAALQQARAQRDAYAQQLAACKPTLDVDDLAKKIAEKLPQPTVPLLRVGVSRPRRTSRVAKKSLVKRGRKSGKKDSKKKKRK